MRLNKKQFRNVVTEEVTKLLGEMLLNEDAERKGQNTAVQYIMSKGYDENSAFEMLNKLRTKVLPDIKQPKYINQNGREKGLYKWAPAVVDMYLDGLFTVNDKDDPHDQGKRNIIIMSQVLKYIGKSETMTKKFNPNLNGKSIDELEQDIMPLINKDYNDAVAAAQETMKQNENQKSDYTVVRIPDYETAEQYAKYMDDDNRWCVTYRKDMYNSYTQSGSGLFYFFLKDGFENVPKVEGKNWPLDEYGLSMIAVSIMADGKINTVTSRWNHYHNPPQSDNVLDYEGLCNVTHLDPSVVCPPYTDEELFEKGFVTPEMLLKKIRNGARPEDVFTKYYIDGDDKNLWYVYTKSDDSWHTYSISEKEFINASKRLYELGSKNIIIPNGVTSIEHNAFEWHSTLTAITIPNTVTSIGYSAFDNCRSLAAITIPNSVATIGEDAFKSCHGLTSITIPNSVVSIGNRVFRSCESLTSIIIPDSVTSIGYQAFSFCSRLSSIELSNNIKYIEYDSFKGCNRLANIIIPNGVTTIGIGAFDGCTSLTSITIPNSVKSIKSGAFYNCVNLRSVIIPDDVNAIERSAFSNCNKLSSVIIGKNVSEIMCNAFAYCANLTSVTVPYNVKYVEIGAFNKCVKLKTAYIENQKTKIEYAAFPIDTKIIYLDDKEDNEIQQDISSEEQAVQSLREVRENFNNLLNRMDGLFI